MPTMFKYKSSVSYTKMYSTFKDHVKKDHCAYILMPVSKDKHLVSPHSLQFDFNARGELLTLSFQFVEDSSEVVKQLLQIQNAIAALKMRWERGGVLSVLNKKGSTILKLDLQDINTSKEYLSEHIDMVSTIFHMPASFAQTMKAELLDQNYLLREFVRLRGIIQKTNETPEKQNPSECPVM